MKGACPSVPQVLSPEDLQAGQSLLFDPLPIPGVFIEES